MSYAPLARARGTRPGSAGQQLAGADRVPRGGTRAMFMLNVLSPRVLSSLAAAHLNRCAALALYEEIGYTRGRNTVNIHITMLSFTPFTISAWVFTTELSADECLRRLMEDVREPPPSGTQRTDWSALKGGHDGTILRRVEGRHVQLLPLPAGRFRWLYTARVEDGLGHTRIVGQYHLDWSSALLWWVTVAAAVLATFGIGVALVLALTEGNASARDILWLSSALAIGGLLVPYFLYDSNCSAERRAARITAVLTQVLGAQERSTSPSQSS